MIEKIGLVLITLGAVYYIYRATFKSKGCNCGKEDCCDSVDEKK